MVPAEADTVSWYVAKLCKGDVFMKERLKRKKTVDWCKRESVTCLTLQGLCLILYYVLKYFLSLTWNNIIL